MYKYDERKTERVDNSMMHVDKVSVTFYLIKNTSTDLSLISKQARVMGGFFFFTDTHTKLPSTVIRQIM